jgi:hypothetical protein
MTEIDIILGSKYESPWRGISCVSIIGSHRGVELIVTCNLMTVVRIRNE